MKMEKNPRTLNIRGDHRRRRQKVNGWHQSWKAHIWYRTTNTHTRFCSRSTIGVSDMYCTAGAISVAFGRVTGALCCQRCFRRFCFIVSQSSAGNQPEDKPEISTRSSRVSSAGKVCRRPRIGPIATHKVFHGERGDAPDPLSRSSADLPPFSCRSITRASLHRPLC